MVEAPSDLDVYLIAAVAANGVIGKDGELPWEIPEDMAHFKETTTGHPVIVGRRTFENVLAGLGGPLPGRTNVVLSRSNPDLPDDGSIVVAESIDDALAAAASAAAERGVDRAYVMGGAAVYDALLDRADGMVLTEIDEEFEGEPTFPGWPLADDWVEIDRDERDGFAFVTYERAE
ncbi:dihydrofolate reductase [Salinarchaeum sp. Harcht-Bsk1]|uniref:dihydrofolate reductase n=1 Tax=Salinarchaeum sp. Harcht-Bsk1 TaxID=1333523 RepID=UPI00034240E4|nr:dihydrofolate reductase [Salinarchaeum sp. Harcht-Bsk1]AGN00499.1 dihydrofolate reductase [Salinarchaeum sp. Harcht-Bsk1]